MVWATTILTTWFKLFDLEHDPRQMTPLKDPETEQRMKNAMIRLMEENETPPEQYIRLGLK